MVRRKVVWKAAWKGNWKVVRKAAWKENWRVVWKASPKGRYWVEKTGGKWG